MLNLNDFPSKCEKCGCTGVHACPGHKIEWTDEQKAELRTVLERYVNKENATVSHLKDISSELEATKNKVDIEVRRMAAVLQLNYSLERRLESLQKELDEARAGSTGVDSERRANELLTCRIQYLEDLCQEAYEKLAPILKVAGADPCLHEETVRLGFIWTKCTQCDRQWADDEGGPPTTDYSEALNSAKEVMYRLSQEKS